jgi:hypothetical protein
MWAATACTRVGDWPQQSTPQSPSPRLPPSTRSMAQQHSGRRQAAPVCTLPGQPAACQSAVGVGEWGWAHWGGERVSEGGARPPTRAGTRWRSSPPARRALTRREGRHVAPRGVPLNGAPAALAEGVQQQRGRARKVAAAARAGGGGAGHEGAAAALAGGGGAAVKDAAAAAAGHGRGAVFEAAAARAAGDGAARRRPRVGPRQGDVHVPRGGRRRVARGRRRQYMHDRHLQRRGGKEGGEGGHAEGGCAERARAYQGACENMAHAATQGGAHAAHALAEAGVQSGSERNRARAGRAHAGGGRVGGTAVVVEAPQSGGICPPHFSTCLHPVPRALASCGAFSAQSPAFPVLGPAAKGGARRAPARKACCRRTARRLTSVWRAQ